MSTPFDTYINNTSSTVNDDTHRSGSAPSLSYIQSLSQLVDFPPAVAPVSLSPHQVATRTRPLSDSTATPTSTKMSNNWLKSDRAAFNNQLNTIIRDQQQQPQLQPQQQQPSPPKRKEKANATFAAQLNDALGLSPKKSQLTSPPPSNKLMNVTNNNSAIEALFQQRSQSGTKQPLWNPAFTRNAPSTPSSAPNAPSTPSPTQNAPSTPSPTQQTPSTLTTPQVLSISEMRNQLLEKQRRLAQLQAELATVSSSPPPSPPEDSPPAVARAAPAVATQPSRQQQKTPISYTPRAGYSDPDAEIDPTRVLTSVVVADVMAQSHLFKSRQDNPGALANLPDHIHLQDTSTTPMMHDDDDELSEDSHGPLSPEWKQHKLELAQKVAGVAHRTQIQSKRMEQESLPRTLHPATVELLESKQRQIETAEVLSEAMMTESKLYAKQVIAEQKRDEDTDDEEDLNLARFPKDKQAVNEAAKPPKPDDATQKAVTFHDAVIDTSRNITPETKHEEITVNNSSGDGEGKMSLQEYNRRRALCCCLVACLLIVIPIAIGIGVAYGASSKRAILGGNTRAPTTAPMPTTHPVLAPSLRPGSSAAPVVKPPAVSPQQSAAPVQMHPASFRPVSMKPTLKPVVVPSQPTAPLARTFAPISIPTPGQTQTSKPVLTFVPVRPPTLAPSALRPVQTSTGKPVLTFAPARPLTLSPSAVRPTQTMAPHYLPTSSTVTGLIAFLAPLSFDNGAAMRIPGTAQNRAVVWLSLDPNLSSFVASRRIQRYAMATVFYSTIGRAWANNLNWLSPSVNECAWYNQASSPCNSNGSLIRLRLNMNGVGGTLPHELSMLSNLQDIALVGGTQRRINGSIPTSFGLLTQLTNLDLNTNALEGALITELGNLHSLTNLDLHGNVLSGSIPSELQSLSKLVAIRLDDNKLQGNVPLGVCATFAGAQIKFFSDCGGTSAAITCPSIPCCTFCCTASGYQHQCACEFTGTKYAFLCGT